MSTATERNASAAPGGMVRKITSLALRQSRDVSRGWRLGPDTPFRYDRHAV